MSTRTLSNVEHKTKRTIREIIKIRKTDKTFNNQTLETTNVMCKHSINKMIKQNNIKKSGTFANQKSEGKIIRMIKEHTTLKDD